MLQQNPGMDDALEELLEDEEPSSIFDPAIFHPLSSDEDGHDEVNPLPIIGGTSKELVQNLLGSLSERLDINATNLQFLAGMS